MLQLPKPLTHVRLTERIEERGLDSCVHVFGRSLCSIPLYALRIGQGGPTTLVVAGHHAMEWICGWVLLSFAEQAILEKTRVRGTWWLVPQLNPDGVQLAEEGLDDSSILAPRQLRANKGSRDFSRWQANARGVDLNHNYPFGFDAYRAVEEKLGIYEGAPTRYSGVAPLSEPETQALATLIDFAEPDITLALHTQGEEVFCGTAPFGRAHALAHICARRLGYRYGRPTGSAAYGGLTDWLLSQGMCALTLECGRGINPLPPEDYFDMERRLLPFLFSLPQVWQYVNIL